MKTFKFILIAIIIKLVELTNAFIISELLVHPSIKNLLLASIGYMIFIMLASFIFKRLQKDAKVAQMIIVSVMILSALFNPPFLGLALLASCFFYFMLYAEAKALTALKNKTPQIFIWLNALTVLGLVGIFFLVENSQNMILAVAFQIIFAMAVSSAIRSGEPSEGDVGNLPWIVVIMFLGLPAIIYILSDRELTDPDFLEEAGRILAFVLVFYSAGVAILYGKLKYLLEK